MDKQTNAYIYAVWVLLIKNCGYTSLFNPAIMGINKFILGIKKITNKVHKKSSFSLL